MSAAAIGLHDRSGMEVRLFLQAIFAKRLWGIRVNLIHPDLHYMIIAIGVSMYVLKAPINSAARAPSTAR